MHPFRAFVIALLLMALPLQGLAAFAPAMDCADVQAVNEAGHEHHGSADSVPAHDHHAPADGNAADSASGHSCCHHVATAVAPGGIAGVPEAPQILIVGVRSLATLFIPELPQRPPRA